MANPIIEFLKSKTVADMKAYPLKESTALVETNRRLLERGGSGGRTPIIWAALKHSQNLVYALLMAGADANKRSNTTNKTALDEITATYNCMDHLKDDYIRYILNERMKNPNSPIHEYVEVYNNGKTYVGGDLVSYKLPSGETKTYRLNATIGAAGYVPFGQYLTNWTEVQFSGPVYGPPAPRDSGCAPPSLSSASGQTSASTGASAPVNTCNPNFITAYDSTMTYVQGCRAVYNEYIWYKNSAAPSTGVAPASPDWTQVSAVAPSGARGGARRRNRMSKRSKARRGSRAKRASRAKRV